MEGLKRFARWLAPVGWYGVIWHFSAQSGEASQEVSDQVLTRVFGIDLEWLANWNWDLMLLASFLIRKAAHMAVFFLLAGLLCWALAPWAAEKRRGWIALGLCGLLAAGDELHQYFVPGRSCMARDVLVDVLGGVCFLGCLWVFQKVRQKREKKAGVG